MYGGMKNAANVGGLLQSGYSRTQGVHSAGHGGYWF